MKKVYVVEDIAISRMSLETMLIENQYEVSGSAATAESAWDEIQKTEIDLLLLDVNLAGQKNGIWLAQQVRKHLNIPIVYLTAYGDQQTLKEVLDTKPDGYLMKPYQEKVLLTTITIALDNFNLYQQAIIAEKRTYVFIKDKQKKIKIKLQDILYVKSEGNYLELIFLERKYVIRKKLSEFMNEISNDDFVQCHRRFVVNTKNINALSKDMIEINSEQIPLSSKYKKEIEQQFLLI